MILRTAALSGLALLAVPASALAFGTTPVPISVGPSGQPANGPSGGATISGDNREARLVAFHSEATNLVSGDTNGATDIFVYSRPRGARGNVRLDAGPARPAGGLRRVSVTNSGRQANGRSLNPALDGALRLQDRDVAPHCVAFQSEASNLTSSDHDSTSDVFVRDLRHNRTIHISRGIGAAATDAAIDGDCHTVGFEAGGRAYLAQVGGSVRSLGRGGDVDLALDGKAVAWVGGGKVKLRRAGRTTTVAPGANPTVSDITPLGKRKVWSVTFQTGASLVGGDHNPGLDVYARTLAAKGGPLATDLISAPRRGAGSLGGDNENGGVTAYAAKRGIVVFANHRESGSTLYYRNNHSGNIDDLAVAGKDQGGTQRPSKPRAASAALEDDRAISEIYTSARSNWVAFTSTSENFPFDGNGHVKDVFFKHLIDGDSL
jgi:hypothetical protein